MPVNGVCGLGQPLHILSLSLNIDLSEILDALLTWLSERDEQSFTNQSGYVVCLEAEAFGNLFSRQSCGKHFHGRTDSLSRALIHLAPISALRLKVLDLCDHQNESL